MISQNKLMAAIEAELTSVNDRVLWRLVFVDKRKTSFVFRVPDGPLFSPIIETIRKICKELETPCRVIGRFYTVEELDEVLGNINWLWQDWIPYGFLTLLVGDPGIGKTMFALDLIRIITNSAKWPMSQEKYSGAHRPTIWVETESSQQLIKIRSSSMKIVRTHMLLPGFGGDILGQPDLMNEEHKQLLINMVREVKPPLIVVDSLGGAHTRGENKIEEVRPMLDFLSKLARDNDTAVVAVHHLRKTGKGESVAVALDRIRGSTAFSAFARSIIALENAGETVKMTVIKANLCRPPGALLAKIEYNTEKNPERIDYTEYHPPAPKKTKQESCGDWLYEYLRTNGETTVSTLIDAADSAGYSRGIFYRAREVLNGSVESVGSGKTSALKIMSNPFG